MNGILPLWKEAGMTSHDCVFKLRKLLKTRKIGHTGTLDPNVDGVLPVCVGSATKMVEYMVNANKQYHGEITLGKATTTEDGDGEVIAEKVVEQVPSEELVDTLMQEMTGEIMQIPPMYSAVKVSGKRLYEYARANQEVERPKRHVTIFKFERTSPIVINEDGTVSWRFSVTCSKGTYVRTLVVDLGEKLGFPAYMSRLTRVQSAGFVPEQCVRLAHIQALTEKERENLLIPIEQAFLDYPRVEIDETMWQSVKNGAVLDSVSTVDYPCFFTYQERIVALYDKHPDRPHKIKPKKMLLGNQEK